MAFALPLSHEHPEFDAQRAEDVPQVDSMTLVNRGLTAIPRDVLSQRSLVSLDLSGNPLVVLPEALTSLVTLYVATFRLISPVVPTCAHVLLSFGPIFACSLPTALRSRESLNLSKTGVSQLPKSFGNLRRLVHLDLNSNLLDALPESFARLGMLGTLYLGGNQFQEFPQVLTLLPALERLYMGANKLRSLPAEIGNLRGLQLLYLGGNELRSVPESIGQLKTLFILNLGENQLSSLPDSISELTNMEALSLQGNQFSVLPPTILKLRTLERLALRNNPLIDDFVNTIQPQVLSLKETCARFIKLQGVAYTAAKLPQSLVEFLDSGKRCTNPTCTGVYFTTNVKSVEFVDFCGKFRLPLQQYLCGTRCTASDRVLQKASQASIDRVLLTGVDPTL
eukprot:m.152129 g.152129  ORF g.152129 m.152129 type:complete len:395 (+) comp52848_c0_seq1:231-1415(+)